MSEWETNPETSKPTDDLKTIREFENKNAQETQKITV
jgi:hypothetical protein